MENNKTDFELLLIEQQKSIEEIKNSLMQIKESSLEIVKSIDLMINDLRKINQNTINICDTILN